LKTSPTSRSYKACPCRGDALHQIGEDVAERLDVVPTTFRVLVTRRPRYGCRSCEGAVVQAPAPARIVEGGIPTEAPIAQVLVSKLAENSPVATDVLRRIAALYAIEEDIRALSADKRRDARDQCSRPIVDDLYRFLEASDRQVSAKSRLGEAIPRWEGLVRFLDDGRIDLDNNAVERAIRGSRAPHQSSA
jgi:transposase